MSSDPLTMEAPSRLSPVKQALLEQRLKAAGARTRASAPSVPRRPDPSAAPLSFIQRQMWVIDQLTPGNPAYNLPYGYRLRGPLDVKALEACVNEIIKRHEILRTTFAARDGEPQQRIHPQLEIAIQVTALDQLTAEEREARLQALASEEAVRSFDLSRLPLIRVSLVKLGHAEHALVINLHHTVADGLSVALLLDELDAVYRAFTGGARPQLPDLALQYGDFAHWQRQTFADEAAHAKRIEFWRTQLGGSLPNLELRSDLPRPALQSFKGSNLFFSIPAALAEPVKLVGAREGCTPFMSLLAAFQVLLQRYSGADDIVIGSPLAARTPSELEPLIGNFLTMAALRCDLSGDPSFLEVLRRTRDTTLNALSQSVPLETLMKHLKFARDPSRNPIFQVMFELLKAPKPRVGDLEVSGFDFDLKFAQCDLSLHLREEAGGYAGRFEYCTDLFHRDTIERLAANLEQLLRAVVEDPDQKLSRIPIVSAPERDRLLYEWNDTAADHPDSRLPALFEAQAERTPGRTALRVGTAALSYAELEARANRLAHALRSKGAGRGQRIGLCVERGSDMLAAVLGILKTGAAYVPLDPAFPAARLRFMSDDAELALLVSTAALAGSCGVPPERQLLLDADAGAIAKAPSTRLAVEAFGAGAEDPAYVIYTSGSTGQPKGVVVPHRAVVNFLRSMAREPGLGEDDVLVAVTTLSFDIAVLELLLPLAVGAAVVIATREEAMDGHALRALLERHRARVMQATPVTWRLLLEAGGPGRTPFKALVGGEALPKDLADQLIARGVELWNMYGPTETTVWSTCARITDTAQGITIGKPIANTTVRVLDAQRDLCPIGVPGELWIGGAGVALGYWKRPELTAERFVPDPFSTTPGATLYRTGDRARWRGDGTLEHLDRLDDQIKLRGFRIEVREIEAAIARHPAVREVAVAAREDTPGDKRLVGYLVAENPPADFIGQVRALLRSALPDYMVPTHFVTLEALPRTQNGKLDRKALPAPDTSREGVGPTFVAARDELEAELVSLWEEVLGTAPIGVEDDFFDLGGHSLLAVRLVAQIERSLRKRIPLATLLKAPTIERLAEVLRTEERSIAKTSPLVPLETRGFRPPLFCVHGHAGEVLFYHPLARRLGRQQPFFALQARGGEGSAAHDRVEDLAADYLAEVRKVQPEGPYYLAGYCFGAKVAFEMAQQFLASGHEVAFLGVFLAHEPKLDLLTWASRKAALHLALFRRLGMRAKLLSISKNTGEKLRRLAWHLSYRVARPWLPRSASLFRSVPDMHLEATRNYRPRTYPGRLTVFLSGPVPTGFTPEPERDLGGLVARTLDLRVVPGDQDTMLKEPFVTVLAERLQAGLEEARPETRRKTKAFAPERIVSADSQGAPPERVRTGS